ncbi:MAG TPA: hypothetical protein VM925_26035, partial [Labilithrix sp.]|nr:hypothetical protein [Labilithrix sp.]
MTYVVLRLVAAVAARLPRAVLYRLGAALGVLAGSVLRIRRALVESAMTRAGVVAPSAVASKMYRKLGGGVFELLFLAGASRVERSAALARVSIDDAAVQALDAGLARGPVILFASHTGNWELAAAAAARLLAERQRRLAVVAKAMHARGVDAFLVRLRRRLGVDVVSPRGALAAARRVLDAGDVVVLPIDQVPDHPAHALPVLFLHETAFADRAPATLAWRSKATVLVVAAEQLGGAHHVRLLDVISPPCT